MMIDYDEKHDMLFIMVADETDSGDSHNSDITKFTGFTISGITKGTGLQPVARGRWIESHDYLRCPKCGAMVKRDFVFFDIGDWNFCPNCGAKMDEGELAELTKNVFGEDYKERERKSTIAEYKNKKEN